MNIKRGDAAGMFAFEQYMSSPAHQPIEDIETQYGGLVSELSRFDGIATANLLGGLLTMPEFAANNIRIETLLKLAHRHGQTRNIPPRKRVQKWLNGALRSGRIHAAEDPPEDVFVGNVMCGVGNVRVFTGAWEGCDSLLQDALSALKSMPNSPVVETLFAESQSLLLLSETVARRCGLDRWTAAGGSAADAISLPSQHILTSRAARLRFSTREFEQLKINPDALEPFIQHIANTGPRGLNTLDQQPLVSRDNDVLLLLPSAVSMAIRMRIMRRMSEVDELHHYAGHVASTQFSDVINEARPLLDADYVPGLSLPKLPADKAWKRQQVVSFDSGKYAHVVFVGDDLQDLLDHGPDNPLDLVRANDGSFVKHLRDVAFSLSLRSDYTGGLTVLIVGGLGRASISGFPDFPDEWFGTMYSPADLMSLAREHEISLLRIWKLKRLVDLLERRHIHLMNVNGDLNLIGHWQKNGYHLLPDECDTRSRSLVVLPTDALNEVRVTQRRKYDVHLAFCPAERAWLQISRLHVHAFFRALNRDAVYVTNRSAWGDWLEGVIETPTRSWWFVIGAPPRENAKQRDTVYRVWDALLAWLNILAPLAERTWPNLPHTAVQFIVLFEKLPDFSQTKWEEIQSGFTELEFEARPSDGTAVFRVPLGFFRLFAVPENDAERAFVRSMLQATATLAGHEIEDAELDNLVSQVIPNKRARSFHLTVAQEFRHYCSAYWKLRCRLVEEADAVEQTIGLAWEIPRLSLKPGKVTDRGECLKVLNAAVDVLWRRIRTQLRCLDRTLLILRCMENIEAIDRDAEHWRISAGALLAQQDDTREVLDVATARESKRAQSTQACRVLIEMAICECPTLRGNIISESEFDYLQASIAALMFFASHSDALHHGVASPPVMVCGTGELKLDVQYHESVINPYLTGFFEAGFRSAADAYGSSFPTADQKPAERIDTSLPGDFVSAVQAEFGILPERLIDLVKFLQNDALKHDELIVITNTSSFKELLLGGGFTAEEINSVLAAFALHPRNRWDCAPSGFRNEDWYPWRFSRRLSLFSRPFVIWKGKSGTNILYAPGFILDAIGAILTRLYSAVLPKEYYSSPEMRRWADAQTLRHGNEFEMKVNDKLSSLGWTGRHGVKMTELGANKTYGNVDVLAWNLHTSTILITECKHLRRARTVGEICEKLRNFRGEEQDDLHAHLRRFEWLSANRDRLSRITKIPAVQQRIVPLLVTNALVPMQFVRDLPLPVDLIVPINQLEAVLPAIIQQSWDIRHARPTR
jgi:hypothetical protein